MTGTIGNKRGSYTSAPPSVNFGFFDNGDVESWEDAEMLAKSSCTILVVVVILAFLLICLYPFLGNPVEPLE